MIYPFETFHFPNGFKSDKDDHPLNIDEKLFPFETFQFSISDFISDNFVHFCKIIYFISI